MTNLEIIEMNRMILIKEGIITEDTELHTYAHWRASYGLFAKKGEHAVAKFPVWKYTSRKRQDMSEEEAQAKGFCFMKNSAWFTRDQVCTREEYIKLFGIDPVTKKKIDSAI